MEQFEMNLEAVFRDVKFEHSSFFMYVLVYVIDDFYIMDEKNIGIGYIVVKDFIKELGITRKTYSKYIDEMGYLFKVTRKRGCVRFDLHNFKRFCTVHNERPRQDLHGYKLKSPIDSLIKDVDDLIKENT